MGRAPDCEPRDGLTSHFCSFQAPQVIPLWVFHVGHYFTILVGWKGRSKPLQSILRGKGHHRDGLITVTTVTWDGFLLHSRHPSTATGLVCVPISAAATAHSHYKCLLQFPWFCVAFSLTLSSSFVAITSGMVPCCSGSGDFCAVLRTPIFQTASGGTIVAFRLPVKSMDGIGANLTIPEFHQKAFVRRCSFFCPSHLARARGLVMTKCAAIFIPFAFFYWVLNI